MKNRTSSFGKSTSMPVLKQRNGDHDGEGRMRFGFSHGFEILNILDAQENFRNQNAKVWSPNGLSNGFLSPPIPSNRIRYGRGSESNGSVSSNKPRERLQDGVKGSPPLEENELDPANLDSTILPKVTRTMMEVLADSPVFQPQEQPSMYALAGPLSTEVATVHGQKSPFWRSPLGATGNRYVHSCSPGKDSTKIHSCDKEPSKNRLPGLGHNSPVTEKFSLPKEFNAPSGNLHHRRHSRHLSLLPNIPSSLGPHHYTDVLGSDKSGVVLPLPISPMNTGQRQDIETKDSAQMFGLHTREPMVNSQGSPFRKPQAFGFGHSRQGTDPFVEPTDKWSQPIKLSPFLAQANPRFTFPPSPEVQVPSTPMFYQQDFESLIGSPRRERVPLTPERENANVHSPLFQQIQSGVPRTPSFQSFNGNPPAPRVDLHIPPPPLSSAQSHLHHTPKTRARLDAQANVRGDWIRTEAKQVVDLSRTSFAAAQRYQQTGSREDYNTWRRLATAYDDATNLEKRQEERRNMFMPQGVKAMKTDINSDQSAAYAATKEAHANAENKGQDKGNLLGFQMAYMERVCADVKSRADEKDDEDKGEISLEMLDTLSLDEKKALREHLIARLEGATAGNRAGVLSKSFI